MAGNLLQTLLDRGDIVAFQRGRLVIEPKSGNPIPDAWYSENWLSICQEILQATGLEAYRYTRYTTGRYTAHKAAASSPQRSLYQRRPKA